MEALHLLLDAGSLWAFDLHIQRKKRKRREAEIQQAATLSIRNRDRERDRRQHRHQLQQSKAGRDGSSLGPNASMYREAHISLVIHGVR